MARGGTERGAILVHVVLALVALLAFTGLVVDQGVLWVARRQAQNIADAAAHAGATALAFSDYDDHTDTGPAKQNALAIAALGRIWGEVPTVTASDIDFPNVPDDFDCDTGANPPCVRVNVYRNAAHGNPLPTFFARLVGVNTQDVQATATAVVASANATSCLKPWMMVDRWQENKNPKDRYNPPQDVYTPPGDSSPGTGFSIADIGTRITTDFQAPNQALRPFMYFPVRVPLPDGSWSDASNYEALITGCNEAQVGLVDLLPDQWEHERIQMTRSAVTALIAQDPTATWNVATNQVDNTCALSTPPCGVMSPRIVPMSLFSPATYVPGQPISIVNIIGLFIEGVDANANITARISPFHGTMRSGPRVRAGSAFARYPELVR